MFLMWFIKTYVFLCSLCGSLKLMYSYVVLKKYKANSYKICFFVLTFIISGR
jgi:hypothetical protein